MEQIYNLLQNVSLESIMISLIIFLLTMVFKYPIKKMTSKLNEDKRKAVNTIIILIPIILSIIISSIYLLFIKKMVNLVSLLQLTFTCFIYSLSLYAIYQRIVIIIKGIKSNSITANEIIEEISQTSNELVSKLHLDEEKLIKIKDSIMQLVESKSLVNSSLNEIFENNMKIEELNKEKQELENEINEIKSSIEKQA